MKRPISRSDGGPTCLLLLVPINEVGATTCSTASLIPLGPEVETTFWKRGIATMRARVPGLGDIQDGELYVATHEGPIFKLVPR